MASKTFAIITDIHSNISALNNALDIIKSRKNVDQIICLGDCFLPNTMTQTLLHILFMMV